MLDRETAKIEYKGIWNFDISRPRCPLDPLFQPTVQVRHEIYFRHYLHERVARVQLIEMKMTSDDNRAACNDKW